MLLNPTSEGAPSIGPVPNMGPGPGLVGKGGPGLIHHFFLIHHSL